MTLVMSLALTIYGGRRYREENPEIVKFNPVKEKKPLSILKSHKLLSSSGQVEEDITWVIK